MRFSLGHLHRRFEYIEPLHRPSQLGILTAARTIVDITNGCLTTWQYSQESETPATSIRFRDGGFSIGIMPRLSRVFGIAPHWPKIGFVSHFSDDWNALEHGGTLGNSVEHFRPFSRANPGTPGDTGGHPGTFSETKPPIAKSRSDRHLNSPARYAGRGVGEGSSRNARSVCAQKPSPRQSAGIPSEKPRSEAFLQRPRRTASTTDFTKQIANSEAKTAFVVSLARVPA